MAVRSTKQSGAGLLACTECRFRQLKCDFKSPSCSRCLRNAFLCRYPPSRRGNRGKEQQISSLRTSSSPSNQSKNPIILSDAEGDQANKSEIFVPTSVTRFSDERFVRLYYKNFHVSHPFLVPSTIYNERQYPDYLQLVVNFVGSQYIRSSSSKQYHHAVLRELTNNLDRSSCMVQAWLIYSIAMFARGDKEEAQRALMRACDIASELGMNQSYYSSSAKNDIEAESLRRTWWELYITDTLLRACFKSSALVFSTLSQDVAFPCEEWLYTGTEELPQPRKMIDLKRRVLFPEDTDFSSFSYLIEATVILDRVLGLNEVYDHRQHHFQSIENALISWFNFLPEKKLEIIDSHGNFEEILFQAHLIIGYASVLLHLPRSDLQPVLSQALWQADSHLQPVALRHLVPHLYRSTHGVKAIEASKRITNILSGCSKAHGHTPFMIPTLAICGLVQLAAAKKHTEECFVHHYNRLTLIIEVLEAKRCIWDLADAAFVRLQGSSAEALSGRICVG